MISQDWCATFGLSEVDQNRLVLSSKDTYERPYGKEMAKGFEALASGYLLSQDKPVAIFVVREDAQLAEDEIKNSSWDTFWNQGLASVLILHLPGKVKIYSLLSSGGKHNRRLPALIDEIDTVLNSLGAHELIRKIDEGSLFSADPNLFPEKNRVDQNLLGNLLKARETLIEHGLLKETAQNLILQVLFIAYLEDRGIIPEQDFNNATNHRHSRLEHLLDAGDTAALDILFANLRGQFNGDVFAGPGLFSGTNPGITLEPRNLQALSGLRKGNVSPQGQFQLFRRYNFRYIPISLLSAIYDRFQDNPAVEQEPQETLPSREITNKGKKRETGSYFTPAHLAQACTSLAWSYIPSDSTARSDYRVLDPACGSAVFLVCIFQRIVGRELARGFGINWTTLVSVVARLHGCDCEGSALHVGIVSLYIALLEHMDPPALLELRNQGNLLPRLYNVSMWEKNFFDHSCSIEGYDLIIGNPPWLSRQGVKVDATAVEWCKNNGYKKYSPNNSPTWAFLWKCGEMLNANGIAALLINAAHVFGIQARPAMRHLYERYRVLSVYNFSDARHQLFEGAKAPAALCIFRNKDVAASDERETTDFWSPKANPDFHVDQRIVLAPEDHTKFLQGQLALNPALLTRAKWGRSRDIALLNDLSQLFPTLGERIFEFQKNHNLDKGKWVIGQGLNPGTRTPKPDHFERFKYCDKSMTDFRWALAEDQLGEAPQVPAFDFLRIVLPIVEERLTPPFILLKQGLDQSTGQLQASYCGHAVTFSKSIQAIASPDGASDAMIFKILTGVLNSRFAAWFYLHSGSVSGVERDKILQQEILLLPFPSLNESPNPNAGVEIASLIDKVVSIRIQQANYHSNSAPLRPMSSALDEIEGRINQCVYSYYGLTLSERQVVEDSYHYILPSLQPRRPTKTRKGYPPLWGIPSKDMLIRYAECLRNALIANYSHGSSVGVTVYCSNRCSLLVAVAERDADYDLNVMSCESELISQLDSLHRKYPKNFGQGVHSLTHIVFAEGKQLVLIKPNRVRHWMPSEGLCDADRIVSDFRRRALGRPK